MAVTMDQVRAFLDSEEPDYGEAAQLGPAALPHLQVLVQGRDAMLASKAAYLASLIQAGDATLDVLRTAAQSDTLQVRVAAAAALPNLISSQADNAGSPNLAGGQAAGLVMDLLNDSDPGVRRLALKAVSGDVPPEVQAKVQHLSQSDPNDTIRELASRKLTDLP